MGAPTLAGILNLLWDQPANAEWKPKVSAVALAQIKDWMTSPDIEVLGLVCSTINERRFRIEPELSLEEYVDFYKLYYGRCMRENPDGKWSDSRWSAGATLVNLIASMWRHDGVPRSVLEGWKHWLAEQYRNGSEDIRTCIVQATLEHLLEQEHFREFFADWKKDPVLKHAYDEASLWHQGGGDTPLGKPPSRKKRSR